MVELVDLFFVPPLAIARLGGSVTPLEAFHWTPSQDIRGAGRTVIEPALSFKVKVDGSLHAYMPDAITFKDGGKLRPVAPFFELWARVRNGETIVEEVVTLELLDRMDLGPEHLRFEISVANKKAQRRTMQTACGFVARVAVEGNDHQRKSLWASSPHDAAHVPLVRHDAPIQLGWFQVIRAKKDEDGKNLLSVIRVRFTPGKGEVYGPPTAIAAMASPLPEGQNLVWARQMQGRMHEMVKPANRILNPDSAWSKYMLEAAGQVDPQPSDSYDGAKNGDQLSWGVVDDTCDGIIQAHLVYNGNRYSAYARVTASPPDYAPDRRMFYSVADDLADRDCTPLPAKISDADYEQAVDEVVDLLARVFETATQINLDAERHHYVCRKGSDASRPPHTDQRSMTQEDTGYARRSALGMIDPKQAKNKADMPTSTLQYTRLAGEVHERLMHRVPLLALLSSDPARVRLLIRPPFGHLTQLPSEPAGEPSHGFRDPRVDRDTKHDMRMPPYMLDSDALPLSLSWRQYHLVMALLDRLEADGAAGKPPEAGKAPGVAKTIESVGRMLRTQPPRGSPR